MDVQVLVFLGLPLDFWASPGDVWVPISTSLDLGSLLGTFLDFRVFWGLFFGLSAKLNSAGCQSFNPNVVM